MKLVEEYMKFNLVHSSSVTGLFCTKPLLHDIFDPQTSNIKLLFSLRGAHKSDMFVYLPSALSGILSECTQELVDPDAKNTEGNHLTTCFTMLSRSFILKTHIATNIYRDKFKNLSSLVEIFIGFVFINLYAPPELYNI
jgi:hypothetical protein